MTSLSAQVRLRCLPAALALLAGCTSPQFTEPSRSGIEQLLLSTATDNSLRGIDLPQVRDQKVYIDETYLESYDNAYVAGAIRALLSENGALLTANRDAADIIVEPRSGALGIDGSESFLGIPAIPVPVPLSGTTSTPRVEFYGATKKNSISRLALLAYRQDGSNVFSTEPLVGKSHFHNYRVLMLVDVNFTDIAEREDY